MTIAFYFNSGLGNALLALPAILELRKNHEVTAVFTSGFPCEKLFNNTVFKRVEVVKSLAQRAAFTAKYASQTFDISILDFFSSTRKNQLMALATSKAVRTNYTGKYLLKSARIQQIEPKVDLHEINQYARLSQVAVNPADALSDFINRKEVSDLPEEYLVIQPFAGNNKAPFKTWPPEKWLAFIEKLQKDYSLVLLGERGENITLSEYLKSSERLINLIGKTSIQEANYILSRAKCFIGHDSYGMHAAALCVVPTFTIWGGSNYKRYGYGFLGKKHQVISQSPACWPCNDYLNPNNTRVNNPIDCPDYRCIKGLTLDEVVSEWQQFIQHI